ncbi:MAG: hypothetical protein MAG715_00840 [Methanonatronarchaeales archaeon]|nr:hypothetical protein [Methanonatronarchaeales archaeon]
MKGPVARLREYLRQRRLERTLQQFEGSVVHLTHVDLDAVASNAIHLRRYGPEEVFTVYSGVEDLGEVFRLLAEVSGSTSPKRLSLSDLNFDGDGEEILKTCRVLKGRGWAVEWRDHHPWRDEVLERFEEVLDHVRVDRDYAGCEVVQMDLLPDDPVAGRIAEIGRDRDLWLNEDPLSERLSTVIGGREWNDRVSRMMARGEYWDEKLERRYEVLEREKELAVERSVDNARVVERGGFRVGVTRSAGYNSDTAHAVRERFGTDLEIVVSGMGTYSLRSPHGVCTAVAEQHGGGGHPNASGGSLGFTFLDGLLFRLRGTRHPKVTGLVDTGLEELEAALPQGTPG